jgi:hypothetical protein
MRSFMRSSLTVKLLAFSSLSVLGGWGLGAWYRQAMAPEVTDTVSQKAKPAQPRISPEGLQQTDLAPKQTEIAVERHAYLETLAQSTLSSLNAALKSVEALPYGPERLWREEMIALRMVELDNFPEIFLTQRRIDSEFSKKLEQAWMRSRGPEALAWSRKQADPALQRSLLDAFVEQAAYHPEAFLEERAQGLKPGPESLAPIWQRATEGTQKAFESLAAKNPARAVELLEKESPGKLRANLKGAVAQAWAKRDLKAARQWAESLADKRERTHAMSNVVRVMARTDAAGARDLLHTLLPDPAVHGGPPHTEVAHALALQDSQEAMRWVKSLPRDLHNVETMLAHAVAPTLGPLDTNKIMDLFEGIAVEGRASDFKEGDPNSGGMVGLLQNWNVGNAEQTFREVLAKPSSEVRAALLNYLAWRVASENPAQAAELAKTASGVELDRLVHHASVAASKQGDLALMQRLVEQADPSRKFQILSAQVEAVAGQHPTRTQEFLATVPKEYAATAGTQLAEAMAQYDPQQALLLAQAVAPEHQQDIYNGVAESWVQQDAPAVAAWAQTLPPAQQQGAYAAMAGGTVKLDPIKSFQFASKLTDPKLRLDNLRAAYQEYIFYDVSAAEAALDAAGLTPEQRAAAAAFNPTLLKDRVGPKPSDIPLDIPEPK